MPLVAELLLTTQMNLQVRLGVKDLGLRLKVWSLRFKVWGLGRCGVLRRYGRGKESCGRVFDESPKGPSRLFRAWRF